MAAKGLDLLVRGGRVVTPNEVLETAVGVSDGRIVALGAESMLPPAERTIDATGKYVLPGLIDCHVHLGAVYDDWHTGPVAAAHAGLTTLLSFVEYDDQARETLPQALKRLRDEAGSQAVIDFGFHFILNNQPYILDGLAEAFEQGVTSYKIFMTYKRRPNRMCSDEFIAQVMEKIAALGGICQLHCENGDILYHLENKSIAAGKVKPTDFPATCPPWTEEEAINRAILIGEMTKCPVYVVHLSTKGGLERIKAAQARGQRVWTETCPQYLLLTEKEMESWGPLAKIGPPLRPVGGGDGDALWGGSREGYIATVASDHSPRPLRQPVDRDTAAADVERGRGQARNAGDVAGAGDGRESRPDLRAVSTKGGDPGRRRRRSHHHRPRRGRDHPGRGPSRGRGLDALRGVEVEGAAVDDRAARAGAAEPGPARAEAGLRPVPGAHGAGGAHRGRRGVGRPRWRTTSTGSPPSSRVSPPTG